MNNYNGNDNDNDNDNVPVCSSLYDGLASHSSPVMSYLVGSFGQFSDYGLIMADYGLISQCTLVM